MTARDLIKTLADSDLDAEVFIDTGDKLVDIVDARVMSSSLQIWLMPARTLVEAHHE